MILLVQTPVYGKDDAHAGPATPPVAYHYQVVHVETEVTLQVHERVVAVIPDTPRRAFEW